MAVNPAGFVQLLDFGTPRIITGYAREVISGGQFVYVSGAADVVSSGANSFVSSDIKVLTGASGNNFFGVAAMTVASGALVPIVVDGCVIVRAAGAIVASQTVTAFGTDDVTAGATAGQVIGRALTGAGSNGFTLIQLK